MLVRTVSNNLVQLSVPNSVTSGSVFKSMKQYEKSKSVSSQQIQKQNLRIPAPPIGEEAAAELPSSAVAPPNRINLGPMYPLVPSSPMAGMAVIVWPQRQPGPSSWLSGTTLTTEKLGAGLGPTACSSGCGSRASSSGELESVVITGESNCQEKTARRKHL